MHPAVGDQECNLPRRCDIARLSGKIALITGGAGGTGLTAARQFSSEGVRAVPVDLDEAMRQTTGDSILEETVSYILSDVTQAEQVASYYTQWCLASWNMQAAHRRETQ